MDYRISSSGKVVSTAHAMKPITAETPRNKALLLLTKQGILTFGEVNANTEHTCKGWAPYPYVPEELCN